MMAKGYKGCCNHNSKFSFFSITELKQSIHSIWCVSKSSYYSLLQVCETHLNSSKVTIVAIIPNNERVTPIIVSTDSAVKRSPEGRQFSKKRNLEQISWNSNQ